MDDIAMNRELVVQLKVSWKRARKDDPTTVMDTIANQFRHVDSELDYEITTRSGQTITKNQIKLSHTVSVGTDDNGLPRREDLWHQMRNWFNDLIERERVLSE